MRRRLTEPIGSMNDMNEIEIQKSFFHPVCNSDEIERIFNVANATDYLLKLRAETIVDHMRLFRVYRNKALANPNGWSLEKSFGISHFENFLNYVSSNIKKKCSLVTFGNMFSNDPNGTIFVSDFGPIITISDSLLFFLKFAHLALLNFESAVPMHVRFNALRIAIRVMLKTEAMDFLMDPRGIVPEDVGEAIHAPISLQMEFIAGHEFAHYVLDHISSHTVAEKPIFHAITERDKDYRPLPVYSKSQQQELDADIHAILLIENDPRHRVELLNAALLWFGCLDLHETVEDVMYQRSPWKPQSHPTARQRFENLLSHVPMPQGYDLSQWKVFLKTIDTLKPVLIEDVSVNMDAYEMYGSVYLDKPDTEWRGPALIDRKDYY